jgi:tetratricopeptide (TPR) repeat protein
MPMRLPASGQRQPEDGTANYSPPWLPGRRASRPSPCCERAVLSRSVPPCRRLVRAGPRLAPCTLTGVVVLMSLAAAASGSAGSAGSAVPPGGLRSWLVTQAPEREEERVFGYAASEAAMQPAMTVSVRQRARGETSAAVAIRRGDIVAMCNVDDEGLVVRRKLSPEELRMLDRMTPKQRKRLRISKNLELRGGSDSGATPQKPPAGENGSDEDEAETDPVVKRPRTSGKDAAASTIGADVPNGVLAGGEDAQVNLDVHNETALELSFNAATDCDALEAMYVRVLEKNSSHVATLQHYGNLLMRLRKNYTGAQQMYERVLEALPDHVPALCNYGNLLHNHLGDFSKAEVLYKKALSLQPNHTTTLSNYGLFLQNVQGDLVQAEELYKKALDTDATHATTLYNFARLLQEEKRDVVGAEDMFKRALQSDPDHSHVLCSYGLLRLVNHHDTDGAEALYRRALVSDPTHVATLYNYGSLLEGVRQNFTGAEEMYKRVLACDPHHPTTLSNYGGLLHTVLREYDRAEEMYQRALARDPNSTATLCNYGLLQQTVRAKYDAAEALYLRSLHVDGGHVATLCNYAYLSATMQNYSKAQELLQQALAAEPAHEFAQHFLGWVRNKTRVSMSQPSHSPSAPPGPASGDVGMAPVNVAGPQASAGAGSSSDGVAGVESAGASGASKVEEVVGGGGVGGGAGGGGGGGHSSAASSVSPLAGSVKS